MQTLVDSLRILSIVAFFSYGIHCIVSARMMAEFGRYGLARYRVLVGVLEVLGSVGLVVGYAYPLLVPVAAGGLTLLMFCGVLTRLRIKDPIAAALPALILMAVNALIFVDATLGMNT